MRTKYIIISVAVLLLMVYCVLAYIYMWPPIVREFWSHHHYSANPCINNLRQIDAAVNQWALVNGKHAGDSVTLDQLKPYIKLNKHGEIPGCVLGVTYSVTVVGVPPTCSFATNPPSTRVRVRYFYWANNIPSHSIP